MKRVRLKISHKGLILVAVPLVFEIAFVVCLLQMLKTADNDAAELAQSRAVVACASELDKSVAKAGYALSSYKVARSPGFLKRYDALAARSLELCDRLSQLSQGNERRQKHAASINELTKRIIKLMSSFRDPENSGLFLLMNKATFVSQLEHAYEAESDEMLALNKEEEEIQTGGSNSALRNKAILYGLIDLVALLNVAVTVALAMYFSKSITRRIGVLTDNTERLAKRDELAALVTGDDEIAALDVVFHQMAKDLRETEQRKQDFVSMITHDLRTPLTSMRTVSTTLAEGAEERDDDEDRQRIGVLERSLDRMISLVNDLLDMDKIDAGLLELDFESAKVSDVVNSSLETVRHLAEQRKITIEVESIDDEIELDQRRIAQVIINLVANAVKYSPRGSVVKVKARMDNDSLKVSVTDTGRGIPEEYTKTIFDRFRQVEKEDSTMRGGTGLGLSISKALIELHGGTIGVDSREGKGSIFWFKFPPRQHLEA